jgi:hypothetical protein
MKTKNGTEDDDTLTASGTAMKINGLGGDDTITGSKGDDIIDGGSGNDSIHGGGGDDQITCGDDGPQPTDGHKMDEAHGDGGSDVLRGEGGSQYLDGGAGSDKVFGGDGNDYVFGGNGSDVLKGEAGNDYLNAGAGKNAIFGGDGNDILESLSGKDTMDGGDGDDRYSIGGVQAHKATITDKSGSETYQIFNADADVFIFDHTGTDKVDLSGLSGETKDDLTFTRDANDLVIAVDGFGGETTIQNFFLTKADRIETLLADDPDSGSSHSYDLSELKGLSIGEKWDGEDLWT